MCAGKSSFPRRPTPGTCDLKCSKSMDAADSLGAGDFCTSGGPSAFTSSPRLTEHQTFSYQTHPRHSVVSMRQGVRGVRQTQQTRQQNTRSSGRRDGSGTWAPHAQPVLRAGAGQGPGNAAPLQCPGRGVLWEEGKALDPRAHARLGACRQRAALPTLASLSPPEAHRVPGGVLVHPQHPGHEGAAHHPGDAPEPGR